MSTRAAKQTLKPDELLAARLLSNHLSANVVPRDIGNADGVHHFDLLTSDYRTINVDVSRLTSQAAQQKAALVDAGKWDNAGLNLCWYVRFGDLASVKTPGRDQLNRLVKAQLMVFETHGVVAPMPLLALPYTPQPETSIAGVNAAVELLREAGVTSCVVMNNASGLIVSTGTGGFAASDAIRPRIETIAIRKMSGSLGRGEGDEKHLFLWTDQWLMFDGLAVVGEPGDLSFPPGLDCIWVAGHVVEKSCLVWRSVGNAWSQHLMPLPDSAVPQPLKSGNSA